MRLHYISYLYCSFIIVLILLSILNMTRVMWALLSLKTNYHYVDWHDIQFPFVYKLCFRSKYTSKRKEEGKINHVCIVSKSQKYSLRLFPNLPVTFNPIIASWDVNSYSLSNNCKRQSETNIKRHRMAQVNLWNAASQLWRAVS